MHERLSWGAIEGCRRESERGGAGQRTSAHRARAGGRREHRVVGIAAVLAGVESGGELNPVERLWLAIRKKLKVFDETIRTSLRALEEHVGEILRAFTPKEIVSLTEYSYIRHSVNAK